MANEVEPGKFALSVVGRPWLGTTLVLAPDQSEAKRRAEASALVACIKYDEQRALARFTKLN